ncbi:MAG TPA: GIY-YIG nuclease family protein [bacterium]|jgi:putative endonuclease|nr:GIY-YIG nuclease family protein [bacterium]HXB96508.1 GIY-YIG nuclease family protein [bacterium]
MKRFFVYLMLYDNGYLYTGYTGNLHRRTKQHYIKGFKAKVLWRECFHDLKEALAREKQIKGWTRAKKLALAEGRIQDLIILSKRTSKKRKLLASNRSATKACPEVAAIS